MKKNALILFFIIALSLAAGCTNNADGPLSEASAGRPAPSAAPPVIAEPGTSKSYYSVEKNGRQGVVNELGQIVLPFEYSEVNVLYYDNVPAAFFAVPAVVKTGRQRTSYYDGLLLSLNGTPLYNKNCRYAYPVCDGLIEIFGTDGFIDLFNAEKCGVISYQGREIIPFRYNSISVCGDYIVAAEGNFYSVLDNTSEVDVYDKEGNLKNSGKFSFVGVGGSLIIVSNDTGTKFGLMNLDFKEIVPVEWDELNSVGNELYIVRRGEKYGVIDGYGKEIVPVKYDYPQFYSDPDDPDSVFFSIATEDGAYIFDGSGNKLFYSDEYISATIQNGAVIAQDKSLTYHYINLEGEEIIPPAQRMYADTFGLISCYNAGVCTYYTKDGVQLPLPESDNLSTVSPGRFIFVLKGKWLYGLCDAGGNIIAPPKYSYLYPCYEKNDLIFFTMTEKYGRVRYGVIDVNDGSILLDGFDMLSYARDGLFYATKGAVHGLIDTGGSWIWQTSDYQSLMD